MDFAFGGVVMPPSGIGSSGDEADDGGALEVFEVGFTHPRGDSATVGRVHPAAMSGPRLGKAVG